MLKQQLNNQNQDLIGLHLERDLEALREVIRVNEVEFGGDIVFSFSSDLYLTRESSKESNLKNKLEDKVNPYEHRTSKSKQNKIRFGSV